MSVQEHGKFGKESSRARNAAAPSTSEASQTWRNIRHSLCQHLHSKNAPRAPWLKASQHCNKEYFCIFNTFQKRSLHYLLAMDIQAEAHHTTAIFYRVINWPSPNIMHSCSQDSLFPLLPKATFCARQRKAGVGLVAPRLRFFGVVTPQIQGVY